MTVTAELRAQIQRLLVRHFNLPELKDLCFELGISYEELPYSTISEFARELILYCERHSLEGCLAEVMCHARPLEDVISVFGQISNCNPRSKIQIVIKTDDVRVSAAEIAKALSRILGNIDPNQIRVVGVALGSVRFLLSVDSSVDRPIFEENLEQTPYVAVTPYDSLPDSDKTQWKTGVVNGKFLPRQEMNQYLRKLLESHDEIVAFSSLNKRESLMSRIVRRLTIGISMLLVLALFAFIVETYSSLFA